MAGAPYCTHLVCLIAIRRALQRLGGEARRGFPATPPASRPGWRWSSVGGSLCATTLLSENRQSTPGERKSQKYFRVAASAPLRAVAGVLSLPALDATPVERASMDVFRKVARDAVKSYVTGESSEGGVERSVMRSDKKEAARAAFADLLDIELTNRGIAGKRLAQELGVSDATVNRLRTAVTAPRPEHITGIARLLNLDPARLAVTAGYPAEMFGNVEPYPSPRPTAEREAFRRYLEGVKGLNPAGRRKLLATFEEISMQEEGDTLGNETH